MKRELLIVGQAPAKSSRARRPFPSDTRSGRRLADLLGVDDVLDAADAVNLAAHYPGKRRNARGDRFPRVTAAWAARILAAQFPRWRSVVLCGRHVAAAFDVEDRPFLEWFELAGSAGVVVPHPSGLNHWWNDEANTSRARILLRCAASGIVPADGGRPQGQRLPRSKA